jgi:hypothetical protein
VSIVITKRKEEGQYDAFKSPICSTGTTVGISGGWKPALSENLAAMVKLTVTVLGVSRHDSVITNLLFQGV